jgi:hypothetical protein
VPRRSPWSSGASVAFRDEQHCLPEERWDELVRIIIARLITERRDPDFVAVFERFRRGNSPRLLAEMGHALAAELERAEDRIGFAAAEFEPWVDWQVESTWGPILAEAFEPLSEREVSGVRDELTVALAARWNRWSNDHPRVGASNSLVRALRWLNIDRSEDGG